MSLPNGFLEELRARVSLASVVGRKVTWERAKTNPARGDYWAPCPFHQEKTASFHVKDREGFYYCFGCQAKGDAITFLRESEGMGFMEAVEVLAQEAGMTMPARDPAEAKRAEARKGLAEVMEACVQHFRLQLKTGRAAEARDYLARRGLGEAAQARFEIGFAPDARQGLAEAMKAKGIEPAMLVKAGMLIAPEEGGAPYDRFRGRIMFPIRDARGRCISFGGRALSPEARAKYLNGPETELFDKGRSLFNHGPAREAAGKGAPVIAAEGYMDVIALVGAGFEGAVAPLGTAVTENQLQMLWKLADEPVVALDGDAAGLRAARRLADLALPLIGPGRSLRFALLPEGKDPDDLIKAEGPEAMQAALDAALPLVEMIWRAAMEGRDLSSPERRAALDRDLGQLLGKIGDANLRRHYADALRERRDALFRPDRAGTSGGGGQGDFGNSGFGNSGFGNGSFGGKGGRKGWGRRGRGAGGFGFAEPMAAPPTPETRRSLLAAGQGAAESRLRECVILWGVLNHPEAAERHEETLRELPFSHPELGTLRDVLLDALPDALESEAPARALGETARALLGRDPSAVLMSGSLSLTRALGPDSPADLAEAALTDALDRHAGHLAVREESRVAMEEISIDTADEIAHRLAYISRERDASLRRGALAEAGASEDEAERSAWLRDFIATEPWRKGPKGRK